ncbi:MAG: hypothetical protein ABUK01_06090 [Leptospirales bacterium]
MTFPGLFVILETQNGWNLIIMQNESLISIIAPVVESVDNMNLKKVLKDSLTKSKKSLTNIDNCFHRLSSGPWDVETMRKFFHVWKLTHLKMLPIYGLSCRILKMATDSPNGSRNDYFMAATKNAETSYQDLNIDGHEIDGDMKTHSDLYNDLANEICDGDSWQLKQYSTKPALAFSKWIYGNMVYQDVEIGLFTNLFSEIFNHGEYTIALHSFRTFLQEQKGYDKQKSDQLALYIKCHVTSGVEVDHFHCVASSLVHIENAKKSKMDYSKAEDIFCNYLNKIGAVLDPLFR